MSKDLVYIFLGSGLGGMIRFGLGKWVNSLHSSHFPLGTLMTNLLACFLLGLVVGLADHRQVISAQARLFWVVGFCGGFSTFSTFSNETLALLNTEQHLINLIYITSSIIFCLVATYGGMMLSQKI